MVLAALDPTLLATGNLALFAVLLLAWTGRLSGRASTVATITVIGALATLGYGLLFAGPAAFPVCAAATIALLAALLLPRVEPRLAEQHVELAALLLLATAGTVALGTSSHLVTLIVGLETLSLAVAVLTALARSERAVEAAFKYFMLSCVAVAAAVYGMGLHALATGSLQLGAAPLAGEWSHRLHVAAIVLLTLGLAFELAVVPFHFAALGPYTTAAPVVAGFVMAAAKLGAVLALAKVVGASAAAVAGPVLVVVGVASILWGTAGAFAQRGLRGVLGYSGIAHGGFLALALGSGAAGQQAAVLYVVVYAATSLLTFAALADRGEDPLESLTGRPLGRLRALALAFGLLSLAGVPPTPGFFAKLAVLGPAFRHSGWLAASLAIAAAVAGALFYLRPLPDLLAADGEERLPPSTRLALLGAGAVIAVFAVAPYLAFRLL
jgi:NADH-quinone oxidoreductase subunit N